MMQVKELGDNFLIKKTVVIILSFILCLSLSLGYILFNNSTTKAHATAYPSSEVLNMVVGDTKQTSNLWYRLGTNNTVTFSSSNTSIATVRHSYGFSMGPEGAFEYHCGIVTAVGEGNAVIIARNKMGDIMWVFPVSVSKRVVDIPLVSTDYMYNGKVINPLRDIDTRYYNVLGDINKIDVGEYRLTLSLKDKKGYKWNDGSIEDKYVYYNIVKSPSTLEAKLNVKSIKASKSYKQYVPIIINKNIKKLSVKISNKKIKIDKNDCLVIPKGFSGNITVTIKDKGNRNHYDKEIKLKLKVTKK